MPRIFGNVERGAASYNWSAGSNELTLYPPPPNETESHTDVELNSTSFTTPSSRRDGSSSALLETSKSPWSNTMELEPRAGLTSELPATSTRKSDISSEPQVTSKSLPRSTRMDLEAPAELTLESSTPTDPNSGETVLPGTSNSPSSSKPGSEPSATLTMESPTRTSHRCDDPSTPPVTPNLLLPNEMELELPAKMGSKLKAPRSDDPPSPLVTPNSKLESEPRTKMIFDTSINKRSDSLEENGAPSTPGLVACSSFSPTVTKMTRKVSNTENEPDATAEAAFGDLKCQECIFRLGIGGEFIPIMIGLNRGLMEQVGNSYFADFLQNLAILAQHRAHSRTTCFFPCISAELNLDDKGTDVPRRNLPSGCNEIVFVNREIINGQPHFPIVKLHAVPFDNHREMYHVTRIDGYSRLNYDQQTLRAAHRVGYIYRLWEDRDLPSDRASRRSTRRTSSLSNPCSKPTGLGRLQLLEVCTKQRGFGPRECGPLAGWAILASFFPDSFEMPPAAGTDLRGRIMQFYEYCVESFVTKSGIGDSAALVANEPPVAAAVAMAGGGTPAGAIDTEDELDLDECAIAQDDAEDSDECVDGDSSELGDAFAFGEGKVISKKHSRIGSSYQALDLPIAENDPGRKSSRDESQEVPEYDQVWDPEQAEKEGRLNFVHNNCPYNKREEAMVILHERGYKISGFLEALQNVAPSDGSDWEPEEKELFHGLMRESRYDVCKVAQMMGKSVNNCLAYHYSTYNVRQTRSSRRANDTGGTNPLGHNGRMQKQSEALPSNTWDVHYLDLQEYKKKNGHCLVPKVYPANQALSSWVFKQRREYRLIQKRRKSHVMTDERLARLRKLGFAFRAKSTLAQSKVDSLRRQPLADAKWESYYQELCTFQRETGHCLVPKKFKENQPLSTWVFKQRAQYKLKQEKQPHTLTPERLKKLNKVGFVWHAKSNKEWQQLEMLRKRPKVAASWENHYRELCSFKRKHGHTVVPKVYPTNQALSTWVFRQRAQYRLMEDGKSHNLTDEWLKKLEKLDFTFRVRVRK